MTSDVGAVKRGRTSQLAQVCSDMFQLPDRSRKAHVYRKNFSRIATVYDRFNDLATQGAHRLWKRDIPRALLRELAKGQADGFRVSGEQDAPGDERFLDLCCGTGDVSLACAKYLPGTIIGLDFSPGMLQVAQSKLDEYNARKLTAPLRLSFVEGDATKLVERFGRDAISGVTMSFGLRNVDNMEQCLQEIAGVLRPGGVFVNLDLGRVRNPVLARLSSLYMYQIVPRLYQLLYRGDNELFHYLPLSKESYPDQDQLLDYLERAGLICDSYVSYLFGQVVMHVARKAGF